MNLPLLFNINSSLCTCWEAIFIVNEGRKAPEGNMQIANYYAQNNDLNKSCVTLFYIFQLSIDNIGECGRNNGSLTIFTWNGS